MENVALAQMTSCRLHVRDRTAPRGSAPPHRRFISQAIAPLNRNPWVLFRGASNGQPGALHQVVPEFDLGEKKRISLLYFDFGSVSAEMSILQHNKVAWPSRKKQQKKKKKKEVGQTT